MFALLLTLISATSLTTAQAADERCRAAIDTVATRAAMLQRFDQDLSDEDTAALFEEYKLEKTGKGRAKRKLRIRMLDDAVKPATTCVTLGTGAPLSDDSELAILLSLTGRTLMTAYLNESVHSQVRNKQLYLAAWSVIRCQDEIEDIIQFAAKSSNQRKFKDEEAKGAFILNLVDRAAEYCELQGKRLAAEGFLNELRKPGIAQVVQQFTGTSDYADRMATYAYDKSTIRDYVRELKKVAKSLKKTPSPSSVIQESQERTQ